MITPSKPQLSSLRVQAAQSAANQPIECNACGSIFMMEVPAGMYTTSASGFRQVNQAMYKVYMCPCGEIQLPAGLSGGAGTERDLFSQSIKLALAAKERKVINLDQVAKGTVSVAEHNALKAQVDQLLDRLSGMLLGEGDQPFGTEEEVEPEAAEAVEAVPAAPEVTEIPLVATGNRGRSVISATQGDVKLVDGGTRAVYAGGARARMGRTGAKTNG